MRAASADALRAHFLGWQCRIRQIAMRQDGGRPSPGMRPRVLATDGRELWPALTVLLVPREPEESTVRFRFEVQRSNDPRTVYERGLALLQADFFQRPEEFSDTMTAALPAASDLAATLLAEARCVVVFDQFRQFYRVPSAVRALEKDDPARSFSIWHNRLFNPSLPADVEVMAFQPDWGKAKTTAP